VDSKAVPDLDAVTAMAQKAGKALGSAAAKGKPAKIPPKIVADGVQPPKNWAERQSC
jgi:hypothetical protein